MAPHYCPVDCFGGDSDLAGTGSTLFSSILLCRPLRFGGNLLNIIFQWIVLEAAQIWWELALHFFPADCFGGSSDLAGTGSTLFSGRLFLRPLRFGGKWLLIIFRWIVFLRWLRFGGNRLHNFFSGGLFWRQLDLMGTGSTLNSDGLI